MLSLHRPSHPSGLTRPGRDANPQQVADYWRRMLVADGAIGEEHLSPFSPDLNRLDNDADYFYGRRAPRHSSQLSSRPEPAESLTDAPRSASALRGGRAFPQGDGLASMTNMRHAYGCRGDIYSPSRPSFSDPFEPAESPTDSPRSAFELRGRQAFPGGDGLAEMTNMRHLECDEDDKELKMALAASRAAQEQMYKRAAQEQLGKCDEDEKELKMALAASRAAQDKMHERTAKEQIDKYEEEDKELTIALAASRATQEQMHKRAAQGQVDMCEEEVKQLTIALAASRADTEQTEKADLEAALALSLSAEGAFEQALHNSDGVADVNIGHLNCEANLEAGVDIPFETPKSLLHDTPAATPASTRKQKKQARGAGVVAGAAIN